MSAEKSANDVSTFTGLTLERDVAQMAPAPRFGAIVSRILVLALSLLTLTATLTPWQQAADGQGRVIANAPVERQQNIEAPIEGRVTRWHVVEGQLVKKGDPIVDIADNDPNLMTRLNDERDATKARIEAAKSRVKAASSRAEALQSSRTSAVAGADQRVAMAGERRKAAENGVSAAVANAKAAELNEKRQQSLFEQGLTSKRAVELAEAEEVRTRMEVDRAQSALSASRSEVVALSADQSRVGNDVYASINDALAGKAMAEAEIASANGELARIDVRLARQSAQHVTAPSDGTILHITARLGVEMVKAGDPLATFVPTVSERAVELWVAGNDVNLIREGATVQLQFEGWPAVQFSGWPSLAVGTFPAKVSFVDPASVDPQGRFRVVCVPTDDARWPERAYLRQGMRAVGWVQLGRVTVAYELWRQFNGFPPAWTGGTTGGDGKAKDKDGKK
jgi:membrane fusion protein, adhesin transport system